MTHSSPRIEDGSRQRELGELGLLLLRWVGRRESATRYTRLASIIMKQLQIGGETGAGAEVNIRAAVRLDTRESCSPY